MLLVGRTQINVTVTLCRMIFWTKLQLDFNLILSLVMLLKAWRAELLKSTNIIHSFVCDLSRFNVCKQTHVFLLYFLLLKVLNAHLAPRLAFVREWLPSKVLKVFQKFKFNVCNKSVLKVSATLPHGSLISVL